MINDYEILTPTGFKPFSGFKKTDQRKAVLITFNDGSDITVSVDHEFLCASGNYTTAKKSRYKKILTEDGFKVVNSVKALKQLVDLYDATDVEGSVYLTNGVASHNCNLLNSFWASVYPIISSSTKSKIIMASTPRDTSGLFYRLYQKSISNSPDNTWVSKVVPWYDVPGRDEKWAQQTRAAMDDPSMFEVEFECKFRETGESVIDTRFFEELKGKCYTAEHILEDGNYKIWRLPEEDRVYSAGVDVSEGVGKDACCVQIFDITDPTSIIQVAQYHNRNISPAEFTPKLHEILQNWGNPLVLIERNNCGAQVVDNLKKYFNYENIVNFGQKEAHRKNNQLLGVICHTNSKSVGLRNFRYWMNVVNSVQIYDVETVNELRDFQRKPNGTWSAANGKHDDRVMSMVWALLLLSEDLINEYFEVVEVDENRRPLIIKQLDFGVQYFMNPTTIYTDSGAGENALPAIFNGSSNPDLDELNQQGWQIFGDFNVRG
jgi:hypothetical protein